LKEPTNPGVEIKPLDKAPPSPMDFLPNGKKYKW
jgi:hypothetical protein